MASWVVGVGREGPPPFALGDLGSPGPALSPPPQLHRPLSAPPSHAFCSGPCACSSLDLERFQLCKPPRLHQGSPCDPPGCSPSLPLTRLFSCSLCHAFVSCLCPPPEVSRVQPEALLSWLPLELQCPAWCPRRGRGSVTWQSEWRTCPPRPGFCVQVLFLQAFQAGAWSFQTPSLCKRKKCL